MCRDNTVVMLTQSCGGALDLAASRLANFTRDMARAVILVDNDRFTCHVAEKEIRHLSMTLLRRELRLCAQRYAAMNDATVGFNIAPQRTLCTFMTGSSGRGVMLDDD